MARRERWQEIARDGKVHRLAGLPLRTMTVLLRAALLLSCAHCLAASGGGLQLEPARRQPVPPPAQVGFGCGNMRLLPPDVPADRALVLEAGLRFETSGRPTKPTSLADDLSEQDLSRQDLSKRIEIAAAAYGHDVSLIKAIVRVESAFNPAAVSPKGAMGLMQIMPATAIGLGVADPHRQLLDPDVNLRAGAQHLQSLRKRFPDRLDLVIAAYNAGEGAVVRWAGVPPFAETRAYVRAVLEWLGRYSNGSSYGNGNGNGNGNQDIPLPVLRRNPLRSKLLSNSLSNSFSNPLRPNPSCGVAWPR